VTSPEFSLVIPFFNEEANCREVVTSLVEVLDQHDVDYELVPVNNGSEDHTGMILSRCAESNPRIRIVTVEKNQGYGWGIVSGLSQCAGSFVGFVDGDLQISPEDILRVYTHIKAHGEDVCKGTRSDRGDGFRRRVISAVYNLFFNLLFKCTVRDVNAKPKVMKHTCYTRLDLQSKDWFIDAELIIKASDLGMRIEEVPVDFKARAEGKSNVYLGSILEFVKNLIIYRMTAGKYHQGASQARSTDRS